MTMPKLEKILAFHLKRAKLALSLVMIIGHVHKDKIVHNNIFLFNVLLHFPPDHVDRVYIKAYNWGLSSCIGKDSPLIYGFLTTA
jgi:hypothetical protein